MVYSVPIWGLHLYEWSKHHMTSESLSVGGCFSLWVNACNKSPCSLHQGKSYRFCFQKWLKLRNIRYTNKFRAMVQTAPESLRIVGATSWYKGLGRSEHLLSRKEWKNNNWRRAARKVQGKEVGVHDKGWELMSCRKVGFPRQNFQRKREKMFDADLGYTSV